jgi:hypothetical protein
MLVARIGHEVPLRPQRDLERRDRASRREPRDQAEQRDARRPQHDDPGHHPIHVHHDVVGVADREGAGTGAHRAPVVALRTRGRQDHRDEDADPRGDHDRRGDAGPQPDLPGRAPHPIPVRGSAHAGSPAR